jgi:hypothetical protein
VLFTEHSVTQHVWRLDTRIFLENINTKLAALSRKNPLEMRQLSVFLCLIWCMFIVTVISEDGCKYLIRRVITRVSQQKHQFTRSSRHSSPKFRSIRQLQKRKISGFEYAFFSKRILCDFAYVTDFDYTLWRIGDKTCCRINVTAYINITTLNTNHPFPHPPLYFSNIHPT